jgi:hypothetical protein
MLDAGQDSDLVDCVVSILFVHFVDLHFLQCIQLVVFHPLYQINLAVRAISELLKLLKVI